MPAVIQTISPSDTRAVTFPPVPVTKVCRPVNGDESRALKSFENHARDCSHCVDPYEVHRTGHSLCPSGLRYARDVADYLYSKRDGKIYSTDNTGDQLVQVEIPAGYDQVRGLLRAIDRSNRHHRPFLKSYDRRYYVPARTAERQPVKVEQADLPKKPSRRRSVEIVEWPDFERHASSERAAAVVDVNKRGSLYIEDQNQRRKVYEKYNVELREPTPRREPTHYYEHHHHHHRRQGSNYHP
ncbi:hypothetical protein BDY21DRAFT_292400 [Lineolata rhizophorae]|uniref:Uncharacterized protein n=1 Tax=Lineolata rhizophorae TaxID=578093 RepID=A0A6A6NQ00_9PEZI|nr:hypothetical protein BDY21DRAFT_292400 [Lineolata rhizophorae]